MTQNEMNSYSFYSIINNDLLVGLALDHKEQFIGGSNKFVDIMIIIKYQCSIYKSYCCD